MITQRKYDDLISDMKYNLKVRNDLLKFGFTTVIATFALAFAREHIPHIIFLIPFFILTPFNSKISQYRLWHASMSAYITVFDDTKIKMENFYIPLEKNIIHKFILFCVRIEFLILSIICLAIFFLTCDGSKSIENYACGILALFLVTLNGAICVSTYNYGKLHEWYEKLWKMESLKHNIPMS